MPKNTKKAKNTKVKTSMVAVKRELLLPTEDQSYAKVVRLLGNCRLECTIIDCNTQAEVSKLGIIRHKIAGKARGHFIGVGDIVLVSRRDFQDDKVDVLHKYNEEEVDRLVNMGELIPSIERQMDIVFKYGNEEETGDDIDVVIDAI